MVSESGLRVSSDQNRMVVVPGGRLDQISAKDIRRRRITGRLTPNQKFHGNLVESRIENAQFDSIDLSRCDWKDCRVENVLFQQCVLGSASFITNYFENCQFVDCTFYDTGISDCEFRECVFDHCDLTALIMKSSRFDRSTFDHCATSNRIVESSLLIDTKWVETDVEPALVLGNFGARQSDFVDCRLVVRQADGHRVASPWNVLWSVAEGEGLSAIERFRLAYFEHEQVEGDAEALQAALDFRNWREDAVVQASFGAQLSGFSQFLLSRYSADKMPIYPLLILHSRNFEFLEWVGTRDDMLALYQVVAGVHLTLTREIDSFASRLQMLSEFYGGARIVHFAANGPLEEAYFTEWLEAVELKGVVVASTRPRNSPIDLGLSVTDSSSLLGLLALFLATRLRMELVSLGSPASPQAPDEHPAVPRQLLAFSSGFSVSRPSEYEINVKTLLPRSLLLDLQLAVNVSVFKRARSVLVGLLLPESAPGDASPPHEPRPASAPKRTRSPRG